MINEKENAPIPGGNQEIEANINPLTTSTLYNIIDDNSTDSGSYYSDGYVDEDPEDAPLAGVPSHIKDAVLKSKTVHEAEVHIIDHEIDNFRKFHDLEYKAPFEEFNEFIKHVFYLCCEAVEYHNNNTSEKVWKKPENLTQRQIEKIAKAIPARSEVNFPTAIADITAEKIAEFKTDHPEEVFLVSTDHIKNSSKNYLLDGLVDTILKACTEEIADHNSKALKSQKWPGLNMLTNSQIIDIILSLYPVISVITQDTSTKSDNNLLLCVYINDPDDLYFGIYSGSEDIFRGIIKKLNHSATNKDIEEIITQLKNSAPRKKRETDRNLIAVGNGIVDYKTKIIRPFDPARIFLSKCPVNYPENPENPILRLLPDGTDTGEDWDVESWMKTLSDDPAIVDLLWKVIGAIIRPNNRWNKAVFLYSESGNSGKGTLCELMRQICGEGGYAALSLADFGKEFYLEPLTYVSAIICDENDVGLFIDKAANLKAIITNDVIIINRKNKAIVTYQFKGFCVQCLNEFPRFKDKSDSLYRRQLFIPMTKCFTGKEKKYIKEVFLHDQRVLEYVLWKVLHMDYYELEPPASCKILQEEYKTFNDPVRDFFDTFKTEFVWDKLPFDFLYDLYGAWMRKYNPCGMLIAKKQFDKEIRNIAMHDDTWSLPNNKEGNFRVDNAMKSKGEPLSFEYDLKDWLNPHYGGPDPERGGIAEFKKNIYYGIVRKGVANCMDEIDPQMNESNIIDVEAFLEMKQITGNRL